MLFLFLCFLTVGSLINTVLVSLSFPCIAQRSAFEESEGILG